MAATLKPQKRASRRSGAPAWALCVVSSEGQAETLRHQQAWAKETAAAHGWRLVRIVDGVATGKAGPRRVVRDLLADLRALEPEFRPERLLMVRADRLGRGSIVDSQIVLRDLAELGVAVWTRDQGEVKLDSAMAELISAATLAVARHENEVRREKMLAVYKRKRAAGETIGYRRPYGLRLENGRDVPDGKRAALVREAFKLRLEGKGVLAIGKRLAAIAPPHAFKSGREYAVRWTTQRVMRLLVNRAYIGVLVTESVFSRAQRVTAMLSNGDRSGDKRRRWPWPLTGAIRCFCSRAMTGIATGTEPHKIRYYGCRATWNHGTSFRLVRAEALEGQFVSILHRLRVSPSLVERYRRQAEQPVSSKLLERTAKELSVKLADIDRKRDQAWELHSAGKVRSGDVQERLDKLAAQREELRGRISEVKEAIGIAKASYDKNRDVDALFKRASEIFSNATEPQQRDIARAVAIELGGLYVTKEGRLEIGSVKDPSPQRRLARK